MKNILAALAGFFGTIGLGLVVMAFCYALSWIVTCGLIYLITLIFGWSFNWLIATGIWIALMLVKFIFTHK